MHAMAPSPQEKSPPLPSAVAHLVHVCVQCGRKVVVGVVRQAGLAEQGLECITQRAGLAAGVVWGRGVHGEKREAQSEAQGREGTKLASADRAGWGRCSVPTSLWQLCEDVRDNSTCLNDM